MHDTCANVKPMESHEEPPSESTVDDLLTSDVAKGPDLLSDGPTHGHVACQDPFANARPVDDLMSFSDDDDEDESNSSPSDDHKETDHEDKDSKLPAIPTNTLSATVDATEESVFTRAYNVTVNELESLGALSKAVDTSETDETPPKPSVSWETPLEKYSDSQPVPPATSIWDPLLSGSHQAVALKNYPVSPSLHVRAWAVRLTMWTSPLR